MPLGAPEDFSADEQQILKTLEQTDPELQAESPAAATEQAATTPSEQKGGESGQTAQGQPDDAATQSGAQADDKATNAEPSQPTGDVRQALRASRRAERQARERAERLEAELAELRSRVPAEPNPDEITEDELREVEESMPFIAKIARRVIGKPAQKEQATEQQAEAQSAPKGQPSVPEVVQDAIDDTPDLLAWQSSQDQERFQAAIEMDKYLATLPAWKDKPLSERFQEVVRRVKADRGELTSQPTTVQPVEIQRARPSTLTDIGGAGQAPNTDPLSLDRMAKMSDDDIVAGLLRQGG